MSVMKRGQNHILEKLLDLLLGKRRRSMIGNRKRLAGLCTMLASGVMFFAAYFSLDRIPMVIIMVFFLTILIGSCLDFIGQLEEREREDGKAEQKSEVGSNGTV
jgi:hypothetical protein